MASLERLRYDAGVLRSHPIVSHDQRIVATAPRARQKARADEYSESQFADTGLVL